MAHTLSSKTRNAFAEYYETLLIAGASVARPTIRFRDASDNDLLIVELSATNPIGDASGGVVTFANPYGESSWAIERTITGTGTCTKQVFVNRDEEVVSTIDGATLVLTGGSDFVTDGIFRFTTAPTITMPAS